ncbi:MAG: ATP-binding protein [Pirellulales bacterium]
MSYHSLKRVLGETSLERKCRFLFGTCLLLLISSSFWWYSKQTDKLVYDANRRAGKALVGTILKEHHWNKLENLFHLAGKMWDPKVIAEDLKTEEYKWRGILPDNPNQAWPPRDAFERELLTLWERAGQGGVSETEDIPTYKERFLPQQGLYQYYQPVYAKDSCIACHFDIGKAGPRPDLVVDNLMAVIQVSFSDKETVLARNKNRAIMLATAIITVFVAMVALYAIVRYIIVKPLAHLRDVSDEISRGNTQMRAEIHTGDEFEELASAFNRMLRHMLDAQEELRGVNRDLDSKVDELAQANMRLYEMNRVKSDFLATVSHELRTPLNSIIGFSDVLSNSDKLEEKKKRYVMNIQRSGRQLLELINDILDLAKIESGKMDVRLADFQIDSVLSAQCDMARPLTEKKNIDLECDVEPNLPDMVQDQGKVQQIVNNLLSNAIKFTPEGGRITVSAKRDASGRLELVVEDTGVGIAEEDQVLIFEKFRQGTAVISRGDTMTREYSGTGLGLSIVKELCRLLGGEVSLESELGQGSRFTVRLPWIRQEQPHRESPLAEQLTELTRGGPGDRTRKPKAPLTPFLTSPE